MTVEAPPPEKIISYLRNTGWESNNEYHQLWFEFSKKKTSEDEWAIEVPMMYSFRDYPWRVGELLQDLSLFEERDQYDIWKDIQSQ